MRNERFWSKVEKLSAIECWEWKASLFPNGYGQFTIKGYPIAAHRFSYAEAKGDIPAGLHIRHVCDNRKCCNPSHLIVGTHQDNMNDKVARGRQHRPPQIYSKEEVAKLSFSEANRLYGISKTHYYRLKRE